MSYKRPSTKIICEQCSTIFYKENREITKTLHHYCSVNCAGIARGSKKNTFSYYISNAKSNSKRNNKEFNLTKKYLEDLFISQNSLCKLSGIPIQLRTRKCCEAKSLNQASLDRLDNSKGYVEGNIQFVALGVNYLRNTCSIDETLHFLTQLKLTP